MSGQLQFSTSVLHSVRITDVTILETIISGGENSWFFQEPNAANISEHVRKIISYIINFLQRMKNLREFCLSEFIFLRKI